MTDLQPRLSTALILRLLRGEPPEMAALQCVLEMAPAYYQSMTGAPPCGALAQSIFTALPPDKTYDDKFVWGLYAGDAMIGCVDVIRGYPVRDKALIGLLLLAEHWQRRGLGRAFAMLRLAMATRRIPGVALMMVFARPRPIKPAPIIPTLIGFPSRSRC